MKGLKTALVVAISAGLLAGSALGVAAQDAAPGPEAATLVSGELIRSTDPAMDCGQAVFETVEGNAEYTRERGRVCGATTEMSDARLSGVVTFMDDADRYNRTADLSDIVWGAISIVNDDGTWEGRSVGTSDVTRGLGGVTYHELVGSGAYDGLSAVLFHIEAEDDLVTGVIFPGVLSDDR